jgi:FemAB-related protein (PEP-CTERM system-associated)
MKIIAVRGCEEQGWDDYVLDSPSGTFYQLIGWKEVMESAYGHETYYYCAKDGDRVLGVMPLLHIKSLMFGHYLTSMPGGLSAENKQVAEALIDKAKQLIERTNANYLILRDCLQELKLPGLVTNEDHYTMIVKLDSDPRKIWLGIDREERRLIKKAYGEGVSVTTGLENLPDFYPIYLKAMRDKGTPPFGIDFFDKISAKFPAKLNLQTVQLKEKILAGGFIAPVKDTVYCTWAGIPMEHYKYRPSHLLLWKAIEYGCWNGYQRADLGRSKKDSGSFKFKLHLGAEPRQLYQYYYLNRISEPPQVGSSRESDPKYRSFVKVWQHLPLYMTEYLGSRLRKQVPFG